MVYVSKKIDKFNVINYFWFERWLFEKKEIFYLWKLSASLLLFCTEISLFECTRSLLWRIKLNWFECWAKVCNAVLGNRLEFIAKVPRFDFKPCDDCYFCQPLCQFVRSVMSIQINSALCVIRNRPLSARQKTNLGKKSIREAEILYW